MRNRTLDIVLAALLIIVVVAFLPFLFIWSVNTLFQLGIAYGFAEWVAAWVFGLFVGAVQVKYKN